LPGPEKIIESLTLIANEARSIAIIWHIILGAFIIGLLFGWRPPKKVAGVFLALPIISVSILAWMYKNPFNGLAFLLIAILLIILSLKLPTRWVEITSLPLSLIGLAMIAFGWIYPHFLGDASLLEYAYSAPVGLIPCPTLSVVIGFALLLNGLGSRSWSLVLAFAGIFYGLFGALRLNVYIDLILVAGTIMFLLRIIMRWNKSVSG
jgi:hypothetical protein